MRTAQFLAALILTIAMGGCLKQVTQTPPPVPEAGFSQYVPATLTGELGNLSAGDRQALAYLLQAARSMDRLYLRQVWAGNEALMAQLANDTTPAGLSRNRHFQFCMGPWPSLGERTSFIAGVPDRPVQANFYPADMTADEFTAWVATLPAGEREKATGFFHVIRRDASGRLRTVPYSEAYRDLLLPAAALLRQAAAATSSSTLREYLTARADAFLSNDYFASDVAWLSLDSPLEVVIGPYETYQDELFGYKAAFTAFITVRNDTETARLAGFAGYLQEIEDHLPILPRYRNPRLGAFAPIRVVDEVAVGGEACKIPATTAFNLPNDVRVITAHGCKRVMLRNVQDAKFRHILQPIAARVLAPTQQREVGFEPYFMLVLAHELMHGLGPQSIVVDGQPTSVREALRETGSALEEAKADIAGLFALHYLIDRGFVPAAMERPLATTYLAGIFRSIRFGLDEAHARGVALQFNYLVAEGAITVDPGTGFFAVDETKFRTAVRKLTGEIMTIQAEGDYRRATAMLERYAIMSAPLQQALDKLADVPVDIAPEFPLAL